MTAITEAVIDGELVVWKSGRIDFTALAPRLADRGSRVLPSTMAPATFLVFVVLALDGCDVRREPLHLRRRQLEGMATAWTPPLQLTPQTGDEGEARRWLEKYGATDLSAWKDWWPRLLSGTKPAIAGG